MREIDDVYDVIPSPKGFCNESGLIETYGKEFEYVKKQNIKNVWTVIEEDGELYVIPGFHIVNRFGYLITEKKWKSKREIYRY